jgi:arylsulfatase A-like enzyme
MLPIVHGLPAGGAEELKRRFGGVVEACYRDVDQRVGRILEAVRGPETLVLVVSDHGFGRAPVPHRLRSEPYSGDHLDQGIILARGPGIAAGSVIQDASVLDVTPTVLARLGLPVAKDMRGNVLAAIVPDAAKVKHIATYEEAAQKEAIHAKGWPERTGPLRPTEAQMP